MSRTETLGFILIFLLLMLWLWMNSYRNPAVSQKGEPVKELARDTVNVNVSKEEQKEPQAVDLYGIYFSDKVTGKESSVIIETDLYTAVLSSKGGVVKRWELKNYKTWDKRAVQLVDYRSNGDFTILLTTTDGKVINTKDLYFDVRQSAQHITLTGDDEIEVTFVLWLSNSNGQLVKRYRFKNKEYGFDAEINLINLGSVIANYQYEVAWENGIEFTEYNSIDEANFACAYIYAGRELTEIDAATVNKVVKKDISGTVSWVATKSKYFAVAIMPQDTKCEGAYVEGERSGIQDEGVIEKYNVSVKIPFSGSSEEKARFKVFIGPIKHDVLSAYQNDLEKIMSLGWVWIVRPIAEYLLLPLFTAIHYVVPNWGLVIIVFSLIIKLVLHPLSKSQVRSMKKMQKLEPMVREIREKYKDDVQKMNQAIMNLYKDYGVNPAGGCLPLLLQFPILFALYALLRGAIELRQAEFIWWITDLSVPDVVFSLPFKFLGIKDVSGIALLMGVTMFIQQKMSVKDPRQKTMVWLMPILMTLIFNGLPSGLNLYYAVYNILAIGEQLLIYRKMNDEPLRKVEQPKKRHGGIFRLAKDLPTLKK